MQPLDPYAPPAGPPLIDARSKVNLPAILIIVAQLLGLVIQIGALVFKRQLDEAVRSYLAAMKTPYPAAAMDPNSVLAFLSIVGGLFVIFAMLEMRKLRRFPIAIAGTVLAMLPIGSLCCFCSLPVGIWALVILFDPDVRAAFDPATGA